MVAEDVHDVAALILERLGEVDTMRLQKLVYYAQAWHLARHEEPLFDADIQAWRFGPVVRALYDVHMGTYGISKWPAGQPERLSTRARQTILWVLAQYGGFSGAELSQLTHAEAPWRLTRGGLPASASSKAVIDRSLMRDYYARQVLEPDAAADAAVENARLEGYEFDKATVLRIRDVAYGRVSVDDAVAEVVRRYQGRGQRT